MVKKRAWLALFPQRIHVLASYLISPQTIMWWYTWPWVAFPLNNMDKTWWQCQIEYARALESQVQGMWL